MYITWPHIYLERFWPTYNWITNNRLSEKGKTMEKLLGHRTAPHPTTPPPLLGACATADASVAASFIDWPNLRAYSSSALFYLTRPTQPNPTPRLNCAIRSMYIYNLYPPPHIPMVSLSFQRPFLSTRENYTPKEFLRLFLLRKN